MEHPQADNELEGEHLVNFVANSLEKELSVGPGEDIEVSTETLYGVLASAEWSAQSMDTHRTYGVYDGNSPVRRDRAPL